ncbi:regulatory protein [Streptomyces viridochromogenes DSM 40736]|uniref:Regulatory protein n=1 Tax=Streptomyces viridochromogenes (strain DSM 40736 / JCM 4977 / BCRC 1201 / Tue 494) TaxID=591159 RepID=D9XFE3_STRVT|nr:regulatory protein [Streptomyces viridochromogenes DSM 40736]
MERLRPSWRPIVSATGDPAYVGVLQRDEQTAEDARQMVAIVLAVWHLEHLKDDAKILVSELASNATRHATGSIVRLTVTRTARNRVRVAVTDKSRTMPQVLEGDLLAESGRGLRLVDALSSNWGVIPLPWGKSVWEEVTASWPPQR